MAAKRERGRRKLFGKGEGCELSQMIAGQIVTTPGGLSVPSLISASGQERQHAGGSQVLWLELSPVSPAFFTHCAHQGSPSSVLDS